MARAPATVDTGQSNPVPPAERAGRVPSQQLTEALLLALLNAHRAGTLAAWLQRHRGVLRWLERRLLPGVRGTAGEALRDDATSALAVSWLLRWAIARLRPDHAAAATPVAREDWLSRTSWRPMLMALCHFGFAPVPAFRDRYHAQPDEPAASQLCGLWSVGPSTCYRYLDKARAGMAAILRSGGLDGPQRLSLRQDVQDFVFERLGLADAAERAAWHGRQVGPALAAGDAPSGLWHQLRAGDVDAFIALLNGRLAELANTTEADALVEEALAAPLPPRQRGALLLALGGLWRMRGDAERELAAYQQALQVAALHDDALLLGRVYGALGKYHEPRDVDRAFAYYEDCTDCLWRAGVGQAQAEAPAQAQPLVEEYVVALVRLAWLFVLRNDPRSKATLDRAEGLRAGHDALSLATLAMLEQAWGEYWRRAADLPRALEHKHRALNLYERAADRQSVLKTCCNLSLVYGEIRDYPRAIQYSQRVLVMAENFAVEPELVASTRLNLGAAHFWQGDHAAAEREYGLALQVATAAQLRLDAGRAHYNLAEVAYLRFRQTGLVADERRGDHHTAAALAIWPRESDAAHADATRRLKGEILTAPQTPATDRLASQESALHPDEHAQVRRQRELLAVPSAPEIHVRAHLAIARAYVAVANREREAALALMHRHGVHERFTSELRELQATWERELTREQQLAHRWADAGAGLVSTERGQAVLSQVLRQGAINKSAYAALCGVSPATASKQLAELSGRGLLRQTGKGPSTRYVLP